ncbi:MAG: hypothetical protein WAM50_17620 [Pseudolabrys sp.]
MTNENDDHLAEDIRARMKEEVAALTPTQRREYAKLISAAEPPPVPDFADEVAATREVIRAYILRGGRKRKRKANNSADDSTHPAPPSNDPGQMT